MKADVDVATVAWCVSNQPSPGAAVTKEALHVVCGPPREPRLFTEVRDERAVQEDKLDAVGGDQRV